MFNVQRCLMVTKGVVKIIEAQPIWFSMKEKLLPTNMKYDFISCYWHKKP